MRSIIFCWEYGAGLGHISALHTLALRLKAKKLKCILVTPEGSHVPEKFNSFDEIIKFPNALGLAGLVTGNSGQIVSYNSAISSFGFGDSRFIFTRLKLWQNLFEDVKPAMVIADYAPTALTCARMLGIPTVAMGNGYTLPPVNICTYPKFVNQDDPVDAVALLNSINQALSLAGLNKLSALPDLFKADIHACFTNPDLDPFGKVREPKAAGPILAAPVPDFSKSRPARSFIYLTHCKPEVATLMVDAALQLDRPVDIYALTMTEAQQRKVQDTNVTFLQTLQSMDTICSNYDLVAHLGGHNLMVELLEAGMKQVVFPIDIEKVLYAQKMENLGLAYQLRMDHTKPVNEVVGKFCSAIDDDHLRTRLEEYSSNRPPQNAAETIAEKIMSELTP